jgi:hypothetical protein
MSERMLRSLMSQDKRILKQDQLLYLQTITQLANSGISSISIKLVQLKRMVPTRNSDSISTDHSTSDQ